MKAMLFAAGIGSRLGKITETTPKSLVEAGGRPMLEHVILNLKKAGVTGLVINLFHLGEKIQEFLKAKDNFSMDIEFSFEDRLLDTGGGLKKASEYFRNEDSFFIHNCDIYCDLDLTKLLSYHDKSQAVATLVTMKRETSRPLYFDNGCLSGWKTSGPGEKLAFGGIHIATPEIFKYMEDEGDVFSIIQTYMKATQAGERIQNYNLEGEFWIDMGNEKKLEELRSRLGSS